VKTADPVNPGNPGNPDKPDTKPTPSSNSDDKISDTNAPQTGDNTVIWPLIVIAALGLSALVFSTCRVRKNMQHNDKG
jgi:LPXTG-motif cell wall-anchored protein